MYQPEVCSTGDAGGRPDQTWNEMLFDLWHLFLASISGEDGKKVLAEDVHNSTDTTALSCNAMVVIHAQVSCGTNQCCEYCFGRQALYCCFLALHV